MNSEPDLRASRSLALHARLKAVAADFALREEQLLREVGSRRTALNRNHRATTTAEGERAAQALAATQEHFRTGEERLRSRHEERRVDIQQGHANAMQNLKARAQQAREKWLGGLQLRHFQAEKNLPLQLQAADREFAQFAVALAGQRETYQRLDKSAWNAFGGCGAFQKMLRRERTSPAGPQPLAGDHRALSGEMQGQLAQAAGALAGFRGFLLPRLFSYVPLAAVLPVLAVGGGLLAFALRAQSQGPALAAGVTVGLLILVLVVHRLGLRRSRTPATALAVALGQAVRAHDASAAAATAHHAGERARIEAGHDALNAEIQQQWDRADDVERDFAATRRNKLRTQMPRAFAKNEEQLGPKIRELTAAQRSALDQRRAEADGERERLAAGHATELGRLATEEAGRWTALVADWQRETGPLLEEIAAMGAALAAQTPAWEAATLEAWTPPREFPAAVRFATLAFDATTQPAPKDARLALPGGPRIVVPLALALPAEASLLCATHDSSEPDVVGTLNNVILRLLATTPPGKVNFTILDPVGLGRNFSGLMHLGDYEETLINRRIWTQRDQIEERLAELNEHLEKVIQMYLRNEYATIADYNAQAGSVAEKYHFLVVADFPAAFSETAVARLQSIASSGPRCGVFLLLHWDSRQRLPDGFVAAELLKHCVALRRENGALVVTAGLASPAETPLLDAPPTPELALQLVHRIGRASIDSNRVEVPFSQIAPKPEDLWTGDTTSELRIAIGRTGATKHQYLAIGKGTRQHALFAGKTGSGKSTLFHVIITNLALACSPEQVEFYLIDFKKGVEFKCYASKRLPHARVVAIESDREFALSVLQRLDEELKRRGDLFRQLGVQDLPGYRRSGATTPIPRTLLLIDEFQEFFVEDDHIAQGAALLFDRIVRQGRAFGLHVLLGSQTLGGAYTLARATLGQMAIRVALQCNEADAYLIMDDNNAAPRLLSRPGEGIYNDAAGALEGNSPFQVVWLGDEERDRWLDQVTALAAHRGSLPPGPIVFEGNAPADLRENDRLRAALATVPTIAPSAARLWLGAPNAIKGPTEAVFRRQSGHHLLLVGQRDEAALGLLGVSLVGLAAQFPAGAARFIVLHSAAPETAEAAFLGQVAALLPDRVTLASGHDLARVLEELSAEQKRRAAAGEAASREPSIFFFIHGLQKFKKLRPEDEFSFSSGDGDAGASPAAQFAELIVEGSTLGLHLVVTVDSFNNVGRALNRKALGEFEMRVIFQMSANDSASLIDSPKAATLGLHRALLYNEQEGTLETFRPYALPDAGWLAEAGAQLAART